MLEVLVASSVLSGLLVGASELVLSAQSSFSRGTGQVQVRVQAQRALDHCVRELRAAAAWSFATAGGSPAGSAGGTIAELTTWDETQGRLAFAFDACPNVLFSRVVDAGIVAGSEPPYLVLDLEPKGLGTGFPWADVGSNGTCLAGRLDDDARKARVLLRTRVVGGRVSFERVLSPAADGGSVPESACAITDLGPATLPGGAAPGGVWFSAAAPGVVRVRVVARSVLAEGRAASVLTSELETEVPLAVLAPPRQ